MNPKILDIFKLFYFFLSDIFLLDFTILSKKDFFANELKEAHRLKEIRSEVRIQEQKKNLILQNKMSTSIEARFRVESAARASAYVTRIQQKHDALLNAKANSVQATIKNCKQTKLKAERLAQKLVHEASRDGKK